MLAKVVPPTMIFLKLSPILKKLSGDLHDDLSTTQAHISINVILCKCRAFNPEGPQSFADSRISGELAAKKSSALSMNSLLHHHGFN